MKEFLAEWQERFIMTKLTKKLT